MQKQFKKTDLYFLMLIAIPYLLPPGLAQFGFYSIVSKLKYISIAIVFILILSKKKITLNKLAFYFSIFSLTLILITFFKGGELLDCIKQTVNILFPIFWIEICLSLNKKKTLKYLTYYYFFIAVLNFLLIIIFPVGIINIGSANALNLVGDDNKMLFTLLPAMAICIVYVLTYSAESKIRRNLIIIISVFMASEVIIFAATGVLSFFITIILFGLDRHSKIAKKIFSLRNCIIAIIVLFYLFVFSDIFEKGVFANFITYVLKKPVNFSGRTTLWSQAITKIMQKPIFGYGYGTENIYTFSFITQSGMLSGFSTHDGYLRILLEGGIVSLILYLNIYIKLFKVCKSSWKNNSNIRIIIFATFGFLIGCIFEAEYYSIAFLLMLGILYDSRKWINVTNRNS